VNYAWTIPSDVNVSGANTSTITIDPSDAALHNGEYSVAVTVDGCELTSAIYDLVINPTPVYDLVINPTPEVISILGGDVYCEGSDVTLTAIIEGATAGSTYEWTGPNGLTHSGIVGTSTVPLNIPEIGPADAGTYR